MRNYAIVGALVGAFALVACGDASTNHSTDFTGVGNGTGPAYDAGGGGTPDSGGGGIPDSGGGGIPDSGASATAFDIMLDKPAADIELRNTVDVQVTVAPKNFTGAVTLDVTGMSAGVTFKLASATLNVSGTTGATTTLTLTTTSSVAPALNNLVVKATSGSNTATTPLALNVKPILTITIPTNVDALKGTTGSPSTNAFGAFPIIVTAPANIANTPVEVKFYNKDSAPHEIHAGQAGAGFPHGAATFATNTFDGTKRLVTATGTYGFYLHDQGDLTEGSIKIQ
jgi:hypothetical protein